MVSDVDGMVSDVDGMVSDVDGMVSGGVEVGGEVGVQSLVNGTAGTMKFRGQRCCWKTVHM